MNKKATLSAFATLLLAGGILSACGNSEGEETKVDENQTEEAAASENDEEKASTEEQESNSVESLKSAYDEAKAELNKAKEDKEVDFDKVIDLYESNLQTLATNRGEEIDQQISTALESAQKGDMAPGVAKQIFDKLMQKAFYLTVKHEFNEIKENWDNAEKVEEELKEAKDFYAIIQGTVQKRDQAYSTNLEASIDGGFSEIEKSIENDDQLAFNLGAQVVDKTLMKTFYLASGAQPHGYATKMVNEFKEDEAHAKVEQAEGWAFYQSISAYLEKYAEEDAAFIAEQFNLQTDISSVDPEEVNKAFVRGFAKIALHEYEESAEDFNEDKGVITGLEGALFIDVISTDLKESLGEEAFKDLNEQAQNYLALVKEGNKEEAMKVLEKIEPTLEKVASME